MATSNSMASLYNEEFKRTILLNDRPATNENFTNKKACRTMSIRRKDTVNVDANRMQQAMVRFESSKYDEADLAINQ